MTDDYCTNCGILITSVASCYQGCAVCTDCAQESWLASDEFAAALTQHVREAVFNSEPQVGQIFRHYKGDLYRVVGLSWDVETETSIARVEYQALEGKCHLTYSRTKANFLQLVETPDYRGPRFVRHS